MVRGLLCFVFAAVVLAGCGKKSLPQVPEEHAPAPAEMISVVGDSGGLTFSWRAPQVEASGEEFHDLTEFRITRRRVTKESRGSDFALIAAVPRQAGQDYRYRDEKIVSGSDYEYRILVVNSDGVESAPGRTIRVHFVGENSAVQLIQDRREAIY